MPLLVAFLLFAITCATGGLPVVWVWRLLVWIWWPDPVVFTGLYVAWLCAVLAVLLSGRVIRSGVWWQRPAMATAPRRPTPEPPELTRADLPVVVQLDAWRRAA